VNRSCHGLRRRALFTALRRCALTTGVLSMLTPAGRADSANTQTTADAQCMVIGARLSASPDPQEKGPGQMILMYYLGRIDGRSPKVDLKTLLKNETQSMKASDLKRAAARCGKEFAARGEDIVQIGKSLGNGKPAK
jgi:hypothetical protein